MNEIPLSSYEPLSLEYYDSSLHPTCADFRDLSGLYISKQLRSYARGAQKILEVGGGKSLAAEVMEGMQIDLSPLFITDISAAMLRHSEAWANKVRGMAVADATRLNEHYFEVDIVIASLGDPYNTPEFWQAVEKVLNPGGRIIFTMPSFDWADEFRSKSAVNFMDVAEFISPAAGKVYVRSNVPPLTDQVEKIKSAGLLLTDFSALGWHDGLKGIRSPKLRNSRFYRYSLVWGITAVKMP